jgi:hypothetical protein
LRAWSLLFKKESLVKPIFLEVVTRTMTTYGQCRHCTLLFDESGLQKEFNKKVLADYPEDLQDEVTRLSDWICELNSLYRHRLVMRVIDAHSPAGAVKCFRHWIRKYPTFVINGKKALVGWDKSKLEELIDKHIQTSLQSRKQGLPLTTP